MLGYKRADRLSDFTGKFQSNANELGLANRLKNHSLFQCDGVRTRFGFLVKICAFHADLG